MPIKSKFYALFNPFIGCFFFLFIISCGNKTSQITQWDEDQPLKISSLYLTIDPVYFQEVLTYWDQDGPAFERPCKVRTSLTDDLPQDANIQIHGGSSRLLAKKSFELSFTGKNLSAPGLFGDFPTQVSFKDEFSNLVLNSHSIDFSGIRNYLSMYATALAGGFAPRVGFVKFYINDQFYGLYQVVDKINSRWVEQLTGHNRFDMVKSYSHRGDMTTGEFGSASGAFFPEEGFELKDGSFSSLRDLVYWLESPSYSYGELWNKLDYSSTLGYVIGCFYSNDGDAFSKNFYLLQDREKNSAYMIRWDADATFGRAWNGEPLPIPYDLAPLANRNGVTQKALLQENFLEVLIRHFESRPYRDALLNRLDALEAILETEILADLEIWSDSILTSVNLFGSDPNWWTTNGSDPASIWRSDLERIREFIEGREESIMLELDTLVQRP